MHCEIMFFGQWWAMADDYSSYHAEVGLGRYAVPKPNVTCVRLALRGYHELQYSGQNGQSDIEP